MKKLIFKILFLTLVVFVPVSAMAGVIVRVNIPLPPPIIFPAPPQVAVIPGTNVYAVPDVKDDIFFYGGWWWRPWEGRWYRSHYYDRGWVYYRHLPPFNRYVLPGWRDHYRDYRWDRIHHQEAVRNWRAWERDRHWERVHGVPPKPGARPGHLPLSPR